MSSIGSHIAAAVAQTALQAEQAARERDRKATQTAADSRRMKELFETHLRALEEGDEFESPDRLHIDQQMPEHEHSARERWAAEMEARRSGGEQKPVQDHPTADTHSVAQPSDSNTANMGTSPQPGDPLYRHLDVQA